MTNFQGEIVEYVLITASVAPKPFKEDATARFLDNMQNFSIKVGAIAVGVLVFGYIANTAFNYSAMRQVSVNREMKSYSGQYMGKTHRRFKISFMEQMKYFCYGNK